jgi:hypothetical protein
MSKWIEKFLPKGLQELTDKPDKRPLLSDLSGLSREHLDKKLLHFDRASFRHAYEERLAITEVDGDITTLHAHRIAYLDAFITLLTALAEEEPNCQDWLNPKIQIALAWLESQELPTLN